jgi:hypothetical protein
MIPVMKAAMVSILIVYIIGFIAIVKFIAEYLVNGG